MCFYFNQHLQTHTKNGMFANTELKMSFDINVKIQSRTGASGYYLLMEFCVSPLIKKPVLA